MEDEKQIKKPNFIKKLGSSIFAKLFGFEQGIDITDEVAVLNRRNVVIKNIILISNMFFSTLLLILSLTTDASVSDWALTVVSFPITYGVNNLLKVLIKSDEKDKTKQQIAAYVASFSIFLIVVLIYAKLYREPNFETIAYVLIFYAIVIISFYQDQKILATSFFYIFIAMTSIHLIFTYNILRVSEGTDIVVFLKEFARNGQLADFLLRTIVFAMFFLVLYAIVSIGQYMQDERRKELIKRRQVQRDFSQIVGQLFDAFFINSYVFVSEKHAEEVRVISKRIASYTSMDDATLSNLDRYAIIHLRYEEMKNLDLNVKTFDDDTYENLKSKTELGSEIVRRMETSQNCEAIVRAQVEGSFREEMMEEIMKTQNNKFSQIILLADIYLTLRKPSSYKRPYAHRKVIDIIEKDMSVFFELNLINRFIRFADELDEIYNGFN